MARRPRAGLLAGLALAAVTLAHREKTPGEERPAGAARDGRAGSAPPSAGQGHQAESPGQIPWPGWWEVLKRVAHEVSEDRVLAEAAAVTFYALLALFPALTALVSIYGLFSDPQTISQQVSSLSGVLPGGAVQVVQDQLHRLTTSSNSALSIGAIFGLLVALWSANGGTKALFDALNVVYDEQETRSFIRLTATTLAFTLASLAFVIVAMVAIIGIPAVLSFLHFGNWATALANILRWPIVFACISVFLAAAYRFGPSREDAKWRWVSWGGALAAAGWLIVSALFSWYVSNFGSYNKTYGSLGAIIGFMTWIWLSAAVILIGAELNSELEFQTSRDTTTGPEKPMGTRGATKADTVARS